VYEHSRGGHAWEAGYVDQPSYRDRTRAFYRTYETDEKQHAASDGMFAHYLLSLDRVGRAHTWTTTDELLAEVAAACGPREYSVVGRRGSRRSNRCERCDFRT
jgi:hypothetical protein